LESIHALARGRYAAVSGNRLTMVFDSHARQVAAAICGFVLPGMAGGSRSE
jgi:hypothetical protein